MQDMENNQIMIPKSSLEIAMDDLLKNISEVFDKLESLREQISRLKYMKIVMAVRLNKIRRLRYFLHDAREVYEDFMKLWYENYARYRSPRVTELIGNYLHSNMSTNSRKLL